PSYIKAIHGPLPQANLIPTGGVNLDNAAEWIKAGAVAIGVGGALTKGNVDQIAKKASELLRIVREARK
ncbi:MAG: 2-dehydro-3-deoxyphosphogluconate aldolase, partial [Thermotogae bacterium]